MRLFCELFLVAVLIWLGWSQSFHDRIDRHPRHRTGAGTSTKSARNHSCRHDGGADDDDGDGDGRAPRQPFLPARPRPPSTPSGDWMWDPAHRNPLDKPAYKTGSAQQTPSQGYWIDSRGVRHYGNSPPPAGVAVGRASSRLGVVNRH